MKSDEQEPHCIIGTKCLSQFLDQIPDKSIVYFHNLGYDICAFYSFIRTSSIDKGRRTMSTTIRYRKKEIIFKDSLSLIAMPLSKFPQAFQLDTGSKEMFPYNYYTFDKLFKSGRGEIQVAGNKELYWDQEQFEKNINLIPNCKIDENHFDMRKYVEFYCNQDVRILKEGFNSFRQMTLNNLNIDVNEVLTAPALANLYFSRNLYELVNNYNVYGGE